VSHIESTIDIRDGRYNIDSLTIDILISKFRYFASIVRCSIFPRIDAQSLNIEFRSLYLSLMKKWYIDCVAFCRVAHATCRVQRAGIMMLLFSTFDLSSKQARTSSYQIVNNANYCVFDISICDVIYPKRI